MPKNNHDRRQTNSSIRGWLVDQIEIHSAITIIFFNFGIHENKYASILYESHFYSPYFIFIAGIFTMSGRVEFINRKSLYQWRFQCRKFGLHF